MCQNEYLWSEGLNLMKMAESYPNRVENTLGSGEIACYKQFLLSTQCFLKARTADTQKQELVWERDKDTEI